MDSRLRAFGKMVREHREAMGLSLAAAAELTHGLVAKQYLSVIERAAPQGRNKKPVQPSREIVDALADALSQPKDVYRQAAGYDSDLVMHELMLGVSVVFNGSCPLLNGQRQRLLDGCRLIAAGVAHEEVDEWLRKAPNGLKPTVDAVTSPSQP